MRAYSRGEIVASHTRNASGLSLTNRRFEHLILEGGSCPISSAIARFPAEDYQVFLSRGQTCSQSGRAVALGS